jgi:hypothetical protein
VKEASEIRSYCLLCGSIAIFYKGIHEICPSTVICMLINKITRDGKCDSDIERRVNAGNLVNGALHAFMGSSVVSQKAQLAVYNGVLLPTLMYESKSWVWQK